MIDAYKERADYYGRRRTPTINESDREQVNFTFVKQSSKEEKYTITLVPTSSNQPFVELATNLKINHPEFCRFPKERKEARKNDTAEIIFVF